MAYLLKIGFHHSSRFYEFEHLVSPSVRELRNGFAAGIQEGVRSLGFFDDEKVGLAHSVKNFQKN